MKIDAHIARLNTYLLNTERVASRDVKKSIEQIGKAKRRGDVEAQTFASELGARAPHIAASQLRRVGADLTRWGLLSQDGIRAAAPQSSRTNVEAVGGELETVPQQQARNQGRTREQMRSSPLSAGPPASTAESAARASGLLMEVVAAQPSEASHVESGKSFALLVTDAEILAAAKAGHSIEWNPQKFPGIFIKPPDNENSVEFFRKVAAALDEIRGETAGFSKSPTGEALLRGLSAQHMMFPEKRVVILGQSESPTGDAACEGEEYAVNYMTEPGERETFVPAWDGPNISYAFDQERGCVVFKNGAGTGSAVFLKEDFGSHQYRTLAMHELTHAYHTLHGNILADFTLDSPDPGKPNATGAMATEETRTTGVGKFFSNPISQSANDIETGDQIKLIYALNSGNAVDDPWERNLADDKGSKRSNLNPTLVPQSFPKTSHKKLESLRASADRAFLKAETKRLRTLQKSCGRHDSEGVRSKRDAQEAMYLETIRLYEKGRYGAAFQLIKRFPKDMLAHLPESKADALQIQNLCAMVKTRYREAVQERLASIRFDPFTANYCDMLQIAAADTEVMWKSLPTSPLLSLLSDVAQVDQRESSPDKILKKLSDIYKKAVYSPRADLAVKCERNGREDAELQTFISQAYAIDLKDVPKQIPVIQADFKRYKPIIDELFLFQADKSSRISEWQLERANQPDDMA